MAGILAVFEIVGIGIARNRHWHTNPCLKANRRDNDAHFALKILPARSTSPHRAHPQRLLEAILPARNYEAPVLRDRHLASRARHQRADRILLPVTTNLRLRRDRDDSLCGPMWPKLSMARVPYSLRAKIKQYTSFLWLRPPPPYWSPPLSVTAGPSVGCGAGRAAAVAAALFPVSCVGG